jgi:hypothetical protein
MRNQGVGSVWAVGFILYAEIIMIMTGIFQVIEGLAALFDDTFYVVTPNYAFKIDASVWGWIHIVIGLLVAVAGFYLFYGKLWARLVGIAAAVVSAISNFVFIPYYPVWSILIIALDLLVIWALTFHGRELAE